ncbi:MAG: hypothetical protein ACFFD4_18620 [Candidatus Odinarchaeota archaeon]
MSFKEILEKANEKASANFPEKEITKIIKDKSPSEVLEAFRAAVVEAKDEKKVRKLIVCLYVLESQGKIAFSKPKIVETKLQLELKVIKALIDEIEEQIQIVQKSLE